ncbi:MAG: hypothetical protein C4523_12435 [Myxococcales bacterium]|nr:MAG: hypothetical protein C4523_12435 [Myxococcales bacterium]
MAHAERGLWKSKLGFILACAGSAIGLGNIVFFPANAYKFGAGAFYIPYLVALVFVGLPLMILEFGLGHHTRRAFPQSLHHAAGRPGEFVGWWAILNASFITMYYITILGWVLGMLIASFGPLFDSPSTALAAFPAIGEMANPAGYFFGMLTSWWPVIFVVVVWALNVLAVSKGTSTIEPFLRFSVPMMWIMMLALIVRGVTLDGGAEGVLLLFTPKPEILADASVWKGAFSQMFFTLSLGFGIMTAYASYLPKKSDHVANSMMVSCMNCAFEYVAGLAVFSLLFVFVIQPKASTLSMMFFIVPQGIAQFPAGVKLFGVLFFALLLIAGLTSSISLVEALVSAMIDKFQVPRKKILAVFAAVGLLGSIAFAWPKVVDPTLDSNGTLGLSLLDLMDHWTFSYGLMAVGLAECLIVGWFFPARRLREEINKIARFKLSPIWDWVIKLVMPIMLTLILGYAIAGEFTAGPYGHDMNTGSIRKLHLLSLAVWLSMTFGGALLFTLLPTRADTAKEERQEGAAHAHRFD